MLLSSVIVPGGEGGDLPGVLADETAPVVQSVEWLPGEDGQPVPYAEGLVTRADITFEDNQGIDPATAADPTNYSLVGAARGDITIAGVVQVDGDTFRVGFDTAGPYENLVSDAYTFTIGSGVTDLAGNPLDGNANGAGGDAHVVDLTATVVVSLPDPALNAAVRDATGVTSGDLHDTDLLGLTGLTIPDGGVEGVRGLEFGTALLTLDFGNPGAAVNHIRDISPLGYLVGLQELSLGNNRLSSSSPLDLSPLSGLTGLEELVVSASRIVDLSPLSGLTALRHVNLSANRFTDISPLSALEVLEELDVSGNPLTDVSPLATLTTLQELDLSYNQITDISPLAGLLNLSDLDLARNSISDISPLSGVTALEHLGLEMNQISELSPLTGLDGLRELDLGRNRVSDVSPLSGLVGLETLNLVDNEVVDIAAVSGLGNLQNLNLARNQIADVSALSGLTGLQQLDLSGNEVEDVSALSGLTDLQSLPLGGNRVSDVTPLSALTGLTALYLRSNEVTDISALSGLGLLQELDLSGNGISDLSAISGLDELEHLWLDGNRITDISPLVANGGLGEGDRVVLQSQPAMVYSVPGDPASPVPSSNPLNDLAYTEHIPALEGRDVGVDYLSAGAITGTVWLDQDADGVRDYTEPSLEEAVVFLDVDFDGERDAWEVSTTTGADGGYAFDPVGPYTYQVRAVTAPGRVVVAPSRGHHPVVLSPGQTADGLDFGVGEVPVRFLDADPGNGLSHPDIAWSVAGFDGTQEVLVIHNAGDRIESIILLDGDEEGSTQDLGIALDDGVWLGRVWDFRANPLPIGFIAGRSGIGTVEVSGPLTGTDLSGFVLDGTPMAEDLDQDGTVGEGTAVYSGAGLDAFIGRGSVEGDIVAEENVGYVGVQGSNLEGDVRSLAGSIGSVVVESRWDRGAGAMTGGVLDGDVSADRSIGSVTAAGDISGSITGESVEFVQAFGGSITGGQIRATGRVGRVVAAGGDVESDVISEFDRIGTVIARVEWNPARSAWAGGSVTGDVSAAAGIDEVYALGGNLVGAVNSGNGALGATVASSYYSWTEGQQVGGRIAGNLTSGAQLYYVGARDLEGDVSADGYLGTVEVNRNMTGSDVSVVNGGLGSVSVMGSMRQCSVELTDGTGNPTGDLGSLFTGADMSETEVQAGHVNWVTILGDMSDSRVELRDGSGELLGRVESVYARGNMHNTIIHARTLGSVIVDGWISEDEGNPDRIHAVEGGFFAKDRDVPLWWISEWTTAERWFDGGPPDGVRAWVGEEE
jgi:internalin A